MTIGFAVGDTPALRKLLVLRRLARSVPEVLSAAEDAAEELLEVPLALLAFRGGRVA